MTVALNLLCRVVRRRVIQGETLEDILNSYPKLTKEEQKVVEEALRR